MIIGVRLRDVLEYAGVKDADVGATINHVHLEGADVDPSNEAFAVSIPAHMAMARERDAILAFDMNGAPLSRDHGYPLRVVVPGTAGVRNVKWVTRIVASEDESKGFFHQNDYRGMSPSDAMDTDYSKLAPMYDVPVLSAITEPQQGKVREKRRSSLPHRLRMQRSYGQSILGPSTRPRCFHQVLWTCK